MNRQIKPNQHALCHQRFTLQQLLEKPPSSADFLEPLLSLQPGADLDTVIFAFLTSSLAAVAQARSLGEVLLRQIEKFSREVVLTQKDS